MDLKTIAMFVGWYHVLVGLAELSSSSAGSFLDKIGGLPSVSSVVPFTVDSTTTAINTGGVIDLIVGAALLWYAHGVKL